MIRAISARIDCDGETLDALWRAHLAFHERLGRIVSILFRMRRGECGETSEQKELYRRIGQFVTGCHTRNAPYLLNAVSIDGWKPGTAKTLRALVDEGPGTTVEMSGEVWAEEAARHSAEGVVLFVKGDVLGGVPASMQQVIVREAAEVVSAHIGKVRSWYRNHGAWLDARAEWEGVPEHTLYLALRPRFAAFEADSGGTLTGRRRRWDRYIEWLRANPDLAAWRGGTSVVHSVRPETLERVRRAPPWRKAAIEAKEFWERNPELVALDALHGFYERTFARTHKPKRNVDGYTHRPTFTLPDPVLHPRWMLFNGPKSHPPGYRNLELPPSRHRFGSVELRLPREPREDGDRGRWVRIRFKADPRLSDLYPVTRARTIARGARAGATVTEESFVWIDRQLGVERPASLRGARLIFSLRNGRPVAAHLRFTLDVEDVPQADAAREIGWLEGRADRALGAPQLRKVPPPGLVTAAVHLGLHHMAFATLAVGDGQTPTLVRARNLRLDSVEQTGRHVGRRSAGPGAEHTARHGRELGEQSSASGQAPRGERSQRRLREHTNRMREDRSKKLARAIVEFALNPGGECGGSSRPYPAAHVLILEKLPSRQSAENAPATNRAISEIGRAKLLERIRDLARDAGLTVYDVPAFGVAQVCSRCGALGRRYSVGSAPESHEPTLTFGGSERLFACAGCGYTADACHNASANLHRQFYSHEAAAAYRDFATKDPAARAALVEALERKLAERLTAKHLGGAPIVTTRR